MNLRRPAVFGAVTVTASWQTQFSGVSQDGKDLLPRRTARAVLTGVPVAGQILTVTPGTWVDADSVLGQWWAGDEAVAGNVPGDGNAYEVPGDLPEGTLIRWRELATNAEGSRIGWSNSKTVVNAFTFLEAGDGKPILTGGGSRIVL